MTPTIEDVLKKHNCYPEQMKSIVPRDGLGGSQFDRTSTAMTEYASLNRQGCRWEVRPVVKWFSEQMEAALKRNDHKGGWKGMLWDELIERIEDETKELKDECDSFPKDKDRVIKEAADVANFAMMIAENYGQPTIDKSIEPCATSSEKEYQWRVHDWMLACFGEEISSNIMERNHRFIEEALELIQATGATKSECHQLVDYVFNRDIGEVNQEIGGVMVTLAALCNALALDMDKAGETELTRIWTKVEKIRAKQAAKPKHSPLPQETPSSPTGDRDCEELKKEVERLKGLIEEVYKVPVLAELFTNPTLNFDECHERTESKWQQFKTEHHL